MLLAVDCGNTNIVFALIDGAGVIRGSWRAPSKDPWTGASLTEWLAAKLADAGHKPDAVTAAALATVVPEALGPLTDMCRAGFGVDALVVDAPGIDLGIPVRVAWPDQVGADRLVNTVAAHEKYGGPLIVVDFGTATTFDMVGSDGAYEGGVISPGINLSLKALYEAAAKLPLIEIAKPEKVIGTDTLGAMRSGIYWGYVGLIEGIVQRMRAEAGKDLRVIATGGLAPLFEGACDCISAVDGTLTLDGLYLIHKRHVGP
ncbi:MAG: type III pantothenate kinase [Rhodospirillaceae bacterium]